MTKRTSFMTAIDGVFCLGCACLKQSQDVFHLSRVTGMRLWSARTFQSLR